MDKKYWMKLRESKTLNNAKQSDYSITRNQLSILMRSQPDDPVSAS